MPGNLLKYFYEVSPIYPKANDFDEKIAAGTTNIFTDSGIEFQKYYEGTQLSIYGCVY